jgi:non-canonical purine NTP pyrophosphatase (RdgB/HAM1 family)
MTKKLSIVVISGNQNKIREIKEIFKDLNYSVCSISDIYKENKEIEENGATFEENAIIKVQAFETNPNYIFLADDSGLEVEALNGKPGIYSARYAGENASSTDLCKKILAELKNETNRKANFTAAIAIKFPNGKIATTLGKVFGDITNKIQGNKGFGYDPIFIPNNYNLTFAQMEASKKNKLSHRFQALQKAKLLLKDTNL